MRREFRLRFGSGSLVRWSAIFGRSPDRLGQLALGQLAEAGIWTNFKISGQSRGIGDHSLQ